MNGAIVTKESITAVVDNQQYTVTRDNVNFDAAMEAARQSDWDKFVDVISPATALVNFGNGSVEIIEGVVYFNGEEVHNVITDRMLELAHAGFDVEPIANFLENLQDNPSKQAVDELYLFLEANNLAITPDGHFLAYKRVTHDYLDLHSRSFDNSIGSVVEMERNKVDDVRDRTCSTGLHFCSLEYLPHFGSFDRGDKVVLVKINPADVVSIPRDYNNAKGRTCRYEVVGETNSDTESAFDEPVMDFNSDIDTESAFDEFVVDFNSDVEDTYTAVPGLDTGRCEKNNSRYEAGSPDWAIEQAHVTANDAEYLQEMIKTQDSFFGKCRTAEDLLDEIRDYCGVASCTEFRTNWDALDCFYAVHQDYMTWKKKQDKKPKRDAQGRFCK